MSTTIKVPRRRVGAMLQALASLNSLDLKDVETSILIADNLNTLRDAFEKVEAEQERIVAQVIDQINGPTIATSKTQVRLNPDQEIQSKLRSFGAAEVELALETIDFQKLVLGATKPSPGAIAELRPILTNVFAPTT